MVELFQHAFETGELPTELPCSVLVLIPKGSGGCRGIGLLEICWNVISKIMDLGMKQGIDLMTRYMGLERSKALVLPISKPS
jgi:hypothetical protein